MKSNDNNSHDDCSFTRHAKPSVFGWLRWPARRACLRHTLCHCKWYIHANFLMPPLIFMWIYVKVGVNFWPTRRVWLADCYRLLAAALTLFCVIVATVVWLFICLTTWHAKSVFELWGVTNAYWVVIFVCDETENHDSWQLVARPLWRQRRETGEIVAGNEREEILKRGETVIDC